MQRAPRSRRRPAAPPSMPPRPPGSLPRPNELSDMGRINALAEPTVAFGPGASPGRPRPVVSTTSAGASPRFLLAIGGGAFWFLASTVAELVSGGPSVDGPLFLAAIALTCLAGAFVGRSIGDDIALALGSIAGLVLSSLLYSVEPAGHPLGDVLSAALYVGVAVVLLTPIVRRVLGTLRQT